MDILFDTDGLIYKIEDDGSHGYGDCCAETMRYHHLRQVRNFLKIDNSTLPKNDDIYMIHALSKFEVKPGVYVRAPVKYLPPEWGDPVSDFSRDQHDPLLMALGACSSKRFFQDCWSSLRERKFFYQNKDVPTPHMFNIHNRAMGHTPRWWWDLGLWPTVLARCGYVPKLKEQQGTWVLGDPDDVADDINLVHLFLQAEMFGHTDVSRRALRFYSQNRITPKTRHTGHNVLDAIAHYYRKDNPGLVALYEPVIRMIFK